MYRHFTVDDSTPVGRYLLMCKAQPLMVPCVLCAHPTSQEQIQRNHRECTLVFFVEVKPLLSISICRGFRPPRKKGRRTVFFNPAAYPPAKQPVSG